MNISGEIINYTISSYVPIIDLYSTKWYTDSLFIKELRKRDRREALSLLRDTNDISLVGELLNIYPDIEMKIMVLSVLISNEFGGENIEKLISMDVINSEDISYIPSNYWIMLRESINKISSEMSSKQITLKQVGKLVLDLIISLDKIKRINYDCLNDLVQTWASTYQGEQVVIDGSKHDFTSDSPDVDAFSIAYEILLDSEDYFTFMEMYNKYEEIKFGPKHTNACITYGLCRCA